MTPLKPDASDETIPMLTEVVELPAPSPVSASEPAQSVEANAELIERVRQTVTAQVMRRLEDAIDIGFRAELQRALQDAVDDACDTLQANLSRALSEAVARAVDEALSNRSASL